MTYADAQLNPEQLRSLAAQLLQRVDCLDKQVETLDKEVRHHKTRNQQLIHEIAQLKRHRFAKRAESFSPDQTSLLDDLLETDLAAIEAELEALVPKPAPSPARQQPKRTALPAEFPRTLIHHEPESTQCTCGCALKRIGEDVSEKLDYTPGVFSVERHIRGKWVCEDCETLIQAPVPAHVIDKGIPTARLLAQVMIAKYADHLPLYRQEKVFARAGLAIPRSTLASWVGTCGVQLQPLVENCASYRLARHDAGLDPAAGKVTLMMHTQAGEDREALLPRLRPALTGYLRAFMQLSDNLNEPSTLDQETTDKKQAYALKWGVEKYLNHYGLFGSAAVPGAAETAQA